MAPVHALGGRALARRHATPLLATATTQTRARLLPTSRNDECGMMNDELKTTSLLTFIIPHSSFIIALHGNFPRTRSLSRAARRAGDRAHRGVAALGRVAFGE